MDTAGLNDRITAAAMAIDPESTLRRVWPLLGGSTALVLACEVDLADGQVRKYVVRTPSPNADPSTPTRRGGSSRSSAPSMTQAHPEQSRGACPEQSRADMGIIPFEFFHP
jgi:hypothetical protein